MRNWKKIVGMLLIMAVWLGKWNGDPQRQYALCPEIWRLDLR